MRRLFLILLVLVLPFQFSWAAAAAYCLHEAPAVKHIGHHEHHHKADAKQLEKAKKSVVDTDCGICHIASLQFARGDTPDTPTILRIELGSELSDPTFASFDARAPDRPQWQRLA